MMKINVHYEYITIISCKLVNRYQWVLK